MNFNSDLENKTIGEIMSNPRLKNDLYDDFMVKYNDDKDSTKS